MNELVLFVFGYRCYYFEKEELLKLSKLLMKYNFPLRLRNGTVYIPLYKCRRFENIVGGRVAFSRTRPRGIGGFILNNRKNIPMILSFFIIFVIWYISSLAVWDIRVSGNKNVDTEAVIEELRDAGLSKGSFWSKIDKTELELSVLSKSDTISWININRQGTVAYVRVQDKIDYREEIKNGYRNIVAACDGVIEEITVRSGCAVVKVGDTVKKGELLISGILPDGTFTHADGTVIARKNENIVSLIESQYQEKEYKEEKIKSIYVNFFDKRINILKIPRNLDTKYDIISVDNTLSFFERQLPISFSVEKIKKYEIHRCEYSNDELVFIAKEKLNEKINERLENGTLIKIRTDGKFVDGAYLIWADLIYSENIAEPLPFLVE